MCNFIKKLFSGKRKIQLPVSEKKAILRLEVQGAESFRELIDLHKKIFTLGCGNKNIDINQYGMFRANSIQELSEDNIYLGNIYGLWTKTISYWERTNDVMSRNVVFKQYQNILLSNLQDFK